MEPRIGDQRGVEACDGDFGTDQIAHAGVRIVWCEAGIEGFVPAFENEKDPLRIDLVAEGVHDHSLEAYEPVVEQASSQTRRVGLDRQGDRLAGENMGGLGEGVAGMAKKTCNGCPLDADMVAMRHTTLAEMFLQAENYSSGGILYGVAVAAGLMDDGRRDIKRHAASALAQDIRECGNGRKRVRVVASSGCRREGEHQEGYACHHFFHVRFSFMSEDVQIEQNYIIFGAMPHTPLKWGLCLEEGCDIILPKPLRRNVS